MNRKNVGKVLAAFARFRLDDDFNLLSIIHGEFPSDQYRGVSVTLGITRHEADRLISTTNAFDRAASAWVIAHLYETGVVDWPLAVARAGLKVAA